MPQSVFPFIQVEMPFELGVPDGRWMVRAPGTSEVQQVIVLSTVRASPAGTRTRRRARVEQPSETGSATVPIARATIVAAQPLPDHDSAQAWIDRIDVEREVELAFAALNKLLQAQRIATADPYLHEVSPSQAIALRAGFGVGAQVAEGRGSHARPLSLPRQRPRWRGRRAAILRSQERLASLLAAERGPLLCEEFALRARLDLDHNRLAHAAGELERALTLACAELKAEPGPGMPQRIDELHKLLGGVSAISERLLGARSSPGTQEDDDALAHALGRLEAALRARAMAITWR